MFRYFLIELVRKCFRDVKKKREENRASKIQLPEAQHS